jgi:hypothetical protein
MSVRKTILVHSVFLAMASRAFAQDIDVVGSCPGDVAVSIIGATPSATVALLTGTPGTTVRSRGACTGATADLADASLLTHGNADAMGSLTIHQTVTLSECGAGLQWMDGATCNFTPVGTIPACSLVDLDADGFDACSGDCDDADPGISPAASDVCGNGLDENCSGTDASCAPVGSFVVADGPFWGDDPAVVSCVEACEQLFFGGPGTYDCSTSAVAVDFSAFVDGWGDITFCTTPIAQDFSLELASNPGYNCGFSGCSYSAYVFDHNCTSTNYCWAR